MRIVIICLVCLFICAVAEAQSFRNVFRIPQPRPTYTAPVAVDVEPRTCEVYFSLTEEERDFIDELDKLRASRGYPQIMLVKEIVQDCRAWSAHMNRVKRLYHGVEFENCAVGADCGVRVFRMWRGSPGHNAKLLKRNDTVGGIGRDGLHWTYRAVSDIEQYRTGKDPESDLLVRENVANKPDTTTGYRVVY